MFHFIYRINFNNKKLILSCFKAKQGKTIPIRAWTDPEGSRKLRLPVFPDIRHVKVARLSALRTGHL